MKQFKAYGFTFNISKIADNKNRVIVEVSRDNEKIDDGYACTKDAEKLFGYDWKEAEADYITNPIQGYQKRLQMF